jgi:hypothetical protein
MEAGPVFKKPRMELPHPGGFWESTAKRTISPRSSQRKRRGVQERNPFLSAFIRVYPWLKRLFAVEFSGLPE